MTRPCTGGDSMDDDLKHLAQQYLTIWLALVIAPALLMTVAPATATSMKKFIVFVTRIWFLPVTLLLRALRSWWRSDPKQR